MTTYGHVVIANNKSGIVPKLIKWITRSNFSHSLITCPDLLGYPMCIEAASNGISMIRFDLGYFLDPTEGYEMYEFQIDDSTKAQGIINCVNRLESSYGYLELPWFAWRALNLLFGRDIKNQNNWCSTGTICSQLSVDYITACGYGQLFSAFGQGSVNAQDVRNVMVANPSLFKLISVKL